MYEPEYVPATQQHLSVGRRGGDVWLSTAGNDGHSQSVVCRFEGGMRQTSLAAFFCRRGSHDLDATETHVWGVRTDSLDVPYVVGRETRP